MIIQMERACHVHTILPDQGKTEHPRPLTSGTGRSLTLHSSLLLLPPLPESHKHNKHFMKHSKKYLLQHVYLYITLYIRTSNILSSIYIVHVQIT